MKSESNDRDKWIFYRFYVPAGTCMISPLMWPVTPSPVDLFFNVSCSIYRSHPSLQVFLIISIHLNLSTNTLLLLLREGRVRFFFFFYWKLSSAVVRSEGPRVFGSIFMSPDVLQALPASAVSYVLLLVYIYIYMCVCFRENFQMQYERVRVWECEWKSLTWLFNPTYLFDTA